MTWTKKTAAAASALLVAVGGMLVTASPAAAALSCPVNRLCIYDRASFGGERIASASTNACFTMEEFKTFEHIVSYRNNLSVNAIVWHVDFNSWGYVKARTLVAGGFSSDIGDDGLGAMSMDKVCMGNASP
ncbi:MULTISPECIES: peptidase inhibitor family I36 protein [unclassified Streptosporangium]|uniref:peptidase inhibitor family I36 protein n=1 Tax=unclassified Streptosporangium TaxID=2632669 RepID=UPI002E2DD9A8|nr:MULTISPECIES: peptidase inhibitor family I36 protein [unclassified Streptosporangium]